MSTNSLSDKSIVILFAKVPARGRVKTRLARDLDDDLVLRLYEGMVADTIDMLEKTGLPFCICIDPPDALDEARARLGPEYVYKPQTGGDLGERMEQAFVHAFSEGFREAVLIGSDIPGLTPEIIREAFTSLARHDAVIGPANDGGYYLIGFTRSTFYPYIFHVMNWSTPTVFRETMERFIGASRLVHVLPERIDLDTREDLRTLLVQLEDQSISSRTLSMLRSRLAE